MKEQFLMEQVAVKADVPVDMNTAAFVGSRIKVAKGDRVAILVNMGDSTGAVVDFTLRQHNAASAGTSKDLSVMNKYYKKAGAATSYTQVEPTVAAANYVLTADFAAQEGVVCFEVLAEDLDVNNDFAWVSIEALDSTAAKLISVAYVLHNVKEKPAYSIAL